ncbi:reverse transcriptase domain, reverse transcriptase zinc-binding domain protein [Tanacetum coccineum]
MGEGEWKEVSRKKKCLVFQRLQYPQSKASLADDLAKISLTVYVSNFPSHLTKRELWNIFGNHGSLMDVFIANRKNKLEQMFAFCRYIKVSDAEPLISSLSNVWIGKLRLHANVARYERKVNGNSSHGVRKASGNSSHVGVKVDPHGKAAGIDQDVKEGEGFLDVEFKYLGGLWLLFEFNMLDAKNKFLNHKGIAAWFSSLKAWHDDFVVEERLIWLEIEGVPLHAWTHETFNQICRKWGEMLFMDDSDGCNRLSKRLCIKSSHAFLVYATIMVSVKDVIYAILVRELYSWTLNFEGDDPESVEEGSLGGGDKKEERFSIILMQNRVSKNIDVHEEADVNDQLCDSDPFELASLINRKCGKAPDPINSETPEFPLGYSPKSLRDQQVSEACHKLSDGDSHKQTGFSMIQRLEETIKVGMALGLNMEGCENTLASLVADYGEFTMNK